MMTPSRTRLVLAASLFLTALLVYLPALTCGYINFDDPVYVPDNPIVHGSPLDAFTRIHAGYWIPLTWMSYQLDYQIGGIAPGGYHLTNILLHAATAALLFLVLVRMTE